MVLRVVACQHQSPGCLLRVAELQVTTRAEGRGHQDTRTSAADDQSVSQSVFTIMEKAPTRPSLNVKVVVAAFNQEKALVGAFSVIVQLHRLIDLRH